MKRFPLILSSIWILLVLPCKQWFLQFLFFRERNHCEHPSSSLIEAPSSAMDVQKWQRNAKIKAWCTCKVVVLLIKPIVLLKFLLPSCRWIFVVTTWTRMLDGKVNGCSQWLHFRRSVASGLEKPLLEGYLGAYFINQSDNPGKLTFWGKGRLYTVYVVLSIHRARSREKSRELVPWF